MKPDKGFYRASPCGGARIFKTVAWDLRRLVVPKSWKGGRLRLLNLRLYSQTPAKNSQLSPYYVNSLSELVRLFGLDI